MMAMMSACAPDAYAHARRVAASRRPLPGRELPEPLVEQVEHCALLHDIGKLAILDPGDVEAEAPQGELQADARRQHVRIGFDILSVVPHLRAAAALVIAVNERWDGYGYPAGLRGREIPIGARASSRLPMPTTS